MEGFIALHRQLLENTIWLNSTPEQKTILITLLLMAWHKEKSWEWRGQKFRTEKGQFVTSLSSIMKNCGEGITIQNVRTALARFEKLEFLTNESTKRGRLITIVNWHIYQTERNEANKETNKDLTKTSQRPNKELTPNNNVNNVNNVNNKNIYTDSPNKDKKSKKKFTFGEYKHVKLTQNEYDKLQSDFGNADELIKFIDEYTEMKGYKCKNWNLAIRKWVVKAVKENKQKPQQGIDLKSKVIQHNFEQREYADTDYDSFISNNKNKGE